MSAQKTFQEINAKIMKGEAVVLTAEEVSHMGKSHTPAQIAEKVDVVTCATFGPMCSSGMFINTGHASPNQNGKGNVERGSCFYRNCCCRSLHWGDREPS